MKVSIIVANYNYEAYLPQAIESLISQCCPDMEIVIVDDESIDSSREIIQQLHKAYPDIIKYVFQKNTGHGGAIASAFAVATGEIIAFLDSDDLWDVGRLNRVIPIFQNDPEVTGVIHKLRTIDRGGKTINGLEDVPVIPNGNLEKLFLETGIVWYYPHTSAITVHRSVLEELLPIDSPEWKTSPDGCILYGAGFLGKIIPIPEILGIYRHHRANTYSHEARYNPNLELRKETLSRVEKTVTWINSFLMQINKPFKVAISKNLNYLREQYYLKFSFSWTDSQPISHRIMTWPFYDWNERWIFLLRFWLKNLKIILNSKKLVIDE